MSRKRRHRLQRKKILSEQKPPIVEGKQAELVFIPTDTVAQVWALGAPFIESGLKGSEVSPEVLKDECEHGDAQLWFAWSDHLEAAAATRINDGVCVLVSCGGKARSRWLWMLDDIEQWAKTQGCNTMRIFGRKGWGRVLKDYHTARLVLDKEI